MKQVESNLQISVDAALKAGNKIIEIYNNQDLIIKQKTDNTPVTQADLESSSLIYNQLISTGFPVITEEMPIPDFEIRKNWKNYWLVDPLDGTKEFIKRNGEFSVNIALIENNIPVLGIIYIPVLQILYFGIKGIGTWKKEKVTGIFDVIEYMNTYQKIECKPSNSEITLITSRSHLNEKSRTFIHKVEAKYQKLNKIESGSSYKLCLLAEGKADVYPRFGPTSEWDTAAGHVFAFNSGIELRSLNGISLLYNKSDLLNPDFIAYNPKRFHFEEFF